MYLGSEFTVIRTTTMGTCVVVLPGLSQESVAVVSVTSTDGLSGTCGSPTGRVVSVTVTTSLFRSTSTSIVMALIVILRNREREGEREKERERRLFSEGYLADILFKKYMYTCIRTKPRLNDCGYHSSNHVHSSLAGVMLYATSKSKILRILKRGI